MTIILNERAKDLLVDFGCLSGILQDIIMCIIPTTVAL